MSEEDFEFDVSDIAVKPSELSEPNLILLYGKAGGGKTWLAASISEVEGLYPVLILDTEGSTVGTVAGFDDDRIDIVRVENRAQFNDLIVKLVTKTHKYKTVIVDTFDVAQEREANYLLETTKNSKGQADTMKAWGLVRTWSLKIARALSDAPFLGIIVNHEATDKTDTGTHISTVMLSGSAKDILPGIPDVVGYVVGDTEDDKETRTVFFGTDTRRATKNRFQLPVGFKEPTMKKIYSHIRKENK